MSPYDLLDEGRTHFPRSEKLAWGWAKAQAYIRQRGLRPKPPTTNPNQQFNTLAPRTLAEAERRK